MEVIDERESFPVENEETEVPARKETQAATWGDLLSLAAPEWKWIGLGCLALTVGV